MNPTTKDETSQFIIGAEVVGDDGTLGRVTRVVVDPVARTITHLVVEPRHRHGVGRLVPVGLVSCTTDDEVTLQCTASDFSALGKAQETHFISGANGAWDYEQAQMLTLPYYALGLGVGMVGGGTHAVVSDVIPYGDIEVRRGDQVHATDGAIGRVQGLGVEPSDHVVTHVLLDEGHLWGKKRVAIPLAAVTRIDDGVRLRLSKQEIEDLPAVDVLEAVSPSGK